MLRTFYVKDYILIDEINIGFGKGLNIITGETGAGKSILVDAMGILLGGRASSEIIRKGASKAIVEGIFQITGKHIKKFIEENELDLTEELILRREVALKGSNRCFINDTPVSLNLYKELGDLLVDLHGQHEHQSLLRKETHIEFLDQYADPGKELSRYQEIYSDIQKSRNELKELYKKEKDLREKKDFYSFQINEIDAVSPRESEDDEITAGLKILENAEKLIELTGTVYSGIFDSEDAVYDKLVKASNAIKELAKIDKQFEQVREECETALGIIKDVADFTRNYSSRISLEPASLESLRSRLASLQNLKKKYGGSLKSVLEYREKIGREFDLAENFSSKISGIEQLIKELKSECAVLAQKISSKRENAARTIRKEITLHLSDLGISNAVFEAVISKNKADGEQDSLLIAGENILYGPKGIDDVEFFISTNPGEDIKPLARVASGGEISRIMLSLKSVLAKTEKLPLLIFDEIDTGISGRIAQKTGAALKKLSALHQIIAITHLPQIAGQADIHFSVQKKISGERVTSSIKQLNKQERIEEVAKLISGENITEASLKGARELIGA